MKPTVLLAALLALSGCYSSTPVYGDVVLYWSFVDARGPQLGTHGNFTQAQPGCADVVVDTVTVTFAGQTYTSTDSAGNASCVGPNGVPGITLQRFHEGTYPYTIQGWRGQELVYQFDGSVDVIGGQTTSQDAVLSALSPQSVPLYFTLNGVQSCTGITGINYAIVDALNNIVAATPTTGVPCDPSSFGVLTVALPLGTYTLTHLQAVQTIPGGAPQSLYELCEQPLSHVGVAQDFNLLPATVGCPR
ncbi:MAG TPA: hypothetical protein VFE30_14285 [Anaeromyxobacteraceae bacterium]|jgi:hypothetical protein|nr:hypothetical protein [Anaeromyxobacteraceae bacterium]